MHNLSYFPKNHVHWDAVVYSYMHTYTHAYIHTYIHKYIYACKAYTYAHGTRKMHVSFVSFYMGTPIYTHTHCEARCKTAQSLFISVILVCKRTYTRTHIHGTHRMQDSFESFDIGLRIQNETEMRRLQVCVCVCVCGVTYVSVCLSVCL